MLSEPRRPAGARAASTRALDRARRDLRDFRRTSEASCSRGASGPRTSFSLVMVFGFDLFEGRVEQEVVEDFQGAADDEGGGEGDGGHDPAGEGGAEGLADG